MAKYDYDFLVIGGGAAGLTAASGAAQLGARTLLVEKEETLGGDCLHYGCVPSKTLIRSAHIYHLMGNGPLYGLPSCSPPVDFSLIAERIRDVIATIQEHDSVERFNRLGAEVAFGGGEFTDEHTVEIDGKSVTAGKILIATGSRAAIPPIRGLGEAGVLTNREIFSLDKLPKSMVVLGAGPIAVEMAQAFSRLGTTVTVIQRSSQILSKEDADMAEVIMQALQQDGIRFHLDAQVQRVGTSGQKKLVAITQDDGEEIIECDEILVALGRKVNTDTLGLEKIDLQFGEKGISVDARLRTNHKHIFAAGDVCGGYQFTHAAGYEGGIALTNAIFRIPRKADYTWMPWCTYTHPELASIGMNEKSAGKAGIAYSVRTEEFSANDRALAEGHPEGRIKMVLDRREKPLGVQILGLHGGELLAEWVAVLQGGLKMSTLAGAIHPYPTLAEINKRVAGSILAEKIFSEKTRKILKTIFRYQGSSIASR